MAHQPNAQADHGMPPPFGPESLPLVSVLTPSFNQAQWLVHNLESVASQNYPHIEHIICDGASVDGSIDILRAASSRCLWTSEVDAGQSDAINKAFRMSHGTIIGWLNSDDAYFSTSTISHVVQHFQRNRRAGVVYGHAALVDGEGRTLQAMWVPSFTQLRLRHYNFLVQPAVFMRRSVLDDPMVDPSFDYMMDRELWMRLSGETCFERADRILAVDRHHPARKSYTRRDLYVKDDGRLVAAYQLRTGRLELVRRKVIKVGMRLMGLTLLRQLQTAPLAFRANRDGWFWSTVRQAAIPRRWFGHLP